MSAGFADRLVKAAVRAGASAAEAFVAGWRTRSLYVEDDAPSLVDAKKEGGAGLRVVVGRRVGFAASTLRSSQDVPVLVQRALAIARAAPEDSNFRSLPRAASTPRRGGSYDARTARAGGEDLRAVADRLMEGARRQKGLTVPKGIVRVQAFRTAVANSLGVESGTRGTLAFLHFTAKMGTGVRAGEGIVKRHAVSLQSFEPEALGLYVADDAVQSNLARNFRGSLSATTVIGAQEMGELLLHTVGYAVDGENVVKGRSPWGNRRGKRVGSSSLTVFDDPGLRGSPMSSPADDEGVATRRRSLVDKGVLRSFVYDAYNAALARGRAGNGYRRGASSVEGCYAVPPDASVSTLVVPPGRDDLTGLAHEARRIVLIEKFAAVEPNPVSGAFALEVRSGVVMERGKGTPIRKALLVGNLYEGLGRLAAVAREPLLADGGIGSTGAAYVPAMALEGFRLVGQG